MVTRTGFEPVNTALKGQRVDRFSNGPYWYSHPDSNWDAFRQRILSPLCLPIPPCEHIVGYIKIAYLFIW